MQIDIQTRDITLTEELRAHVGVSLEIGNFCTLSTLFNQFGYVSD